MAPAPSFINRTTIAKEHKIDRKVTKADIHTVIPRVVVINVNLIFSLCATMENGSEEVFKTFRFSSVMKTKCVIKITVS